MGDVTQLLSAIEQGDPTSSAQLLPLLYDELRRLAAAKMARESPDQSLEATALVHEAHLRLVGNEQTVGWQSRGHFFTAASEAMRRILVERARRRHSERHGGGRRREPLQEHLLAAEPSSVDVLLLDEGLRELERREPQAAQLVKLRYFAGLSHQEAAEALGISRRVADRLWTLGRTWLYRWMNAAE
jgi:RNA polymerase sigma factor (TIGR02999 family)